MAVKCPSCGTRDNTGGSCHVCGARLGRPLTALLVGLQAAGLYGALWVAISWLTALQLPYLALGYGAVVTLAVGHWSKGRGCLYQLISSSCTVAGMAIAETTVVRLYWHELTGTAPGTPLPPFWSLLLHLMYEDPFTILFVVLGVMGGMTLWAPWASTEDWG